MGALKHVSTGKLLSIETLMEDIRCVAVEKLVFEYLDMSLL